MQKYFIHIDQQSLGPFDIHELQTKQLSPKTPVWYRGLPNWTTAGEVDELKVLFAPELPPPYRKPTLLTHLVQLNGWWWFLVFVGMGLLMFWLGQTTPMPELRAQRKEKQIQPKPVVKAPSPKELEQSTPTKFLVTEGSYKVGFLGTKVKVNGTVQSNATAAAYKDVVIRVVSYDAFQQELSRRDITLTDTIRPKSAIVFDLKLDKAPKFDTIVWKVVKAKPLG